MVSERDKRLAGQRYDPLDPEWVRARARARRLCQALNATGETDSAVRRHLLTDLLGAGGHSVWVEPPFFCDYGSNIRVGEQVFFNVNCVVLDACPVTLGDFTRIGPAVQLDTATHPMDPGWRRTWEFAKPITVGAEVWIGGGTILCPGVIVGAPAVIGAGSVVTRAIPARVFATGNPCRIIRAITESSEPASDHDGR